MILFFYNTYFSIYLQNNCFHRVYDHPACTVFYVLHTETQLIIVSLHFRLYRYYHFP